MAFIEDFSLIPRTQYDADKETRLAGSNLLVDDNVFQMNTLITHCVSALTFPFKPVNVALNSSGNGIDLGVQLLDEELNPIPQIVIEGTINDDNIWVPQTKVAFSTCGRRARPIEGYVRDYWGDMLLSLGALADSGALVGSHS